MNQILQHPLKDKVDFILRRSGDLYAFIDIVEAVRSGRMQSFALNDSWAVVQIVDYPRRRVLEVVFIVGNMADTEQMESEVIGWAREQGATLISTIARNGWRDTAKERGWRNVATYFIKDLTDGS